MKYLKTISFLAIVAFLFAGCFHEAVEMEASIIVEDKPLERKIGGSAQTCDLLGCACPVSINIANVNANPGWEVKTSVPAGPAGLIDCEVFDEVGHHSFWVNNNGSPMPAGASPNFTYWVRASFQGSNAQSVEVTVTGCMGNNVPFVLTNTASSKIFNPSAPCL